MGAIPVAPVPPTALVAVLPGGSVGELRHRKPWVVVRIMIQRRLEAPRLAAP